MIRLDPAANRTYHYWHVHVPGLTAGQLYGYRVEGPSDPASGMRFDATKLLLDPYGRGVAVPDGYQRIAASRPGEQLRDRDEERGRGSARLRLGRRQASAAAVGAHDRL